MTLNSAPPRRIGIFSDVHGNYHALEAVLKKLDSLGLDHLVCLGDVVGYGAMPNECIALLRERGIPTLAGNHDHAAVEMTDITYFNDIAKQAVYWTRQALTEENRQWLRERPYVYELSPEYYFVHASPKDPEAWNYVITFGEARMCFEMFQQRICFIGHSHQPAVVELAGEELHCPEGLDIPMKAKNRYLINVGSVGQPRDRIADACCVHVDLDEAAIHFNRVEYEVKAAQEAILSEGLPEELAVRLGYGW